jgi:putative Ca2+/H+ antiporter (TMEM165/GDT1 family)/methyl-accepting chemotaxis protein
MIERGCIAKRARFVAIAILLVMTSFLGKTEANARLALEFETDSIAKEERGDDFIESIQSKQQQQHQQQQQKKKDTFMRRRSLLTEEREESTNKVTEDTVEQIAADVEDATDAVDEAAETVAEAAEQVEDASEAIEEASEAIAEAAEQQEEVVEAVEDAAEAVQESTEAIEDAAGAVDDATEAVEDAAQQIQDTADVVEEVAADVQDATAAVDDATEAVEDAADSLADIADQAQEVLLNLEGSKGVNKLVLDKVEQEQGAVATELLTMAKEINRLEAAVSRLEDYEGRRGSAGGAGLGQWFKAQYADQTSFISALVTSFLVILFIEVGDRTYFIAALMSVKYSRRVVFLGAFSALAVMTIVSTLLGVAAPMFLPRWFVHWAAVILFLGYGVSMLYNSQFLSDEVSEEFEEVEHELDELAHKTSQKKSDDNNISLDDDDDDNEKMEKGKASTIRIKMEKKWWEFFVSAIFVQAFTLTFLAEWGDRSQIATIAMAADYDPYGIIIGGSLGHGVATSTACIGGRILAQKISEKKIAMVGGSIFLLFGILAIFDDPSADYAKALPQWMQQAKAASQTSSSA